MVYHGVRDDRAEVTFQGRKYRYQIHHVLDFDPTRKRMSTVIEDEEGDIFLLVKGAETAILDRCTTGDVDIVERHVIDYAMVSSFEPTFLISLYANLKIHIDSNSVSYWCAWSMDLKKIMLQGFFVCFFFYFYI